MSKRKLLLADDSVTIQKVVNLTFADEGIDVITVGDGNSAMAKIAEAAPDVILADVHMPGLSGYQVCEMVRSNEATKGLPVVLLVGSFEPFDENEAARVGANAFLTKPFQSIRQLVSQVSDLMQASPPAAADAVAEVPSEFSPTVEEGVDTTIADEETPASAKMPDTTDIDHLYAQSFGEGREEDAGSPTYVDAGMDDEMIETVHADNSQAEEQFASTHDQGSVSEYQEPAPGYDEPTAAYDQPADHHQQTDEYQDPAAGFNERTTDEYLDPAATYQEPSAEYHDPASADQEQSTQYQDPTATYLDQPTHEYHDPAAGYHDSVAATPESPAETSFQEFSVAPSPFDSPAHEVPTAPSESYEPIQDYSVGQQSSKAPDRSTAHFVLDENDPLELPPIAGGKTIEFRVAPGTDEEPAKQVVSLSPELMDALVEKVVNKLSKKE